jgi:hypothetical protein
MACGRRDALRIELRLLREDIHRITLELRERALKVQRSATPSCPGWF